jgi:hypothetical protein
VYYYTKFSNAIGRPTVDLICNELNEDISNGVTFKQGKVFKIEENDNVFCFFDLIDVLIKTESKFYPYKEYGFDYKNITASRGVNDDFKNVDKESELLEKIKNTKNVEEKNAYTTELNSLYASHHVLKEQIIDDINVGFLFDNLVWNKDIPNLSLRVNKKGHVDISSLNLDIKDIETTAFRTYNIIMNGGLYNVDVLPVELNFEAYNTLRFHGIIKESFEDGKIYKINLKDVPYIINNKMIQDYSFKRFCQLEYKKLVYQAEEKVIKHFIDEPSYDLLKDKYNGISDVLIEKGFKSAGYGIIFSPTGTSYLNERTDFIDFLTCEIKIKSFSSLPSMNAVLTKLTSKKSLTPSESMMNMFISKYEKMNQEDLKASKIILEKERRTILDDIAKFKFIKLVGGENFTDIENIYEEPTHVFNFDGTDYNFTYVEENKQEKV